MDIRQTNKQFHTQQRLMHPAAADRDGIAQQPTHPAVSQLASRHLQPLRPLDVLQLQRMVGNRVVSQLIRRSNHVPATLHAPTATSIQRQIGKDAQEGQKVVKDTGEEYVITNRNDDKEMSQIVYTLKPETGDNRDPFLVPDDNRLYHWETYIDPQLEADERTQGLFHPGMTLAEVEQVLNTIKARGVMYEIGIVFKNDRLRRVVKGKAAGPTTQAVVHIPTLMNDDKKEPVPIDSVDSVMTHNHPVGHPLSTGDIAGAVVRNMKEIRAVGISTFSMSRTTKDWGIGFQGKGVHANFDVLSQLDAFWRGLSWKRDGLKQLGLRDWGITIEGRLNKIDLANEQSSFYKAMDHYWFLHNLARKYGWIMDDGIGNNIRAYARLALQIHVGIDKPDRYISP